MREKEEEVEILLLLDGVDETECYKTKAKKDGLHLSLSREGYSYLR